MKEEENKKGDKMKKLKRYIIKKINNIVLNIKVLYNLMELREEREHEINREIKKLIITKR